jgi:para-nitrobenzyl esterase
MRHLIIAAAIAALAPAAVAQTPPAAPAPAATPAGPTAPVGLALAVYPAKSSTPLTVTTPAFANGGDIPFENTKYRGNIFPGLAWSKGPAGTKSYAVIMQDADVNYRGGPLLHWTMYGIPAGVTKLDAAMTTPPAGASFGPNVRGPAQSYMGPRTPPGPKHHYHFAILALDVDPAASPTLTYDQLAAAIGGHVLASGEVIGLGQADPTAVPPTPPASNAAAAPH